MKTKIPPIDLKAEFHELQPELLKCTRRVFESGRYILGKELSQFENSFARFVGTKYAIGVASCSDALLISLMACGIKRGDEVLTTPFTFIATATAIVRLGAKPVFIDVEPDTFNLDPDLIRKSLSRKTRGIIPVHLYGNPCRMDEIGSIAKKHNLFVIEDCAQACGARFQNRQVGSFGDFGAFSFYPTKTLGAIGDAGMVTTNQKSLYEKVKSFRHHGDNGRFHAYKHVRIGINSRLDEIQAAILNVKFKSLSKWNEARRKAVQKYDRLLSKFVKAAKISHETPKGRSVYHQYVIRVLKRDELLKHLQRHGISASVYYPIPLHLQPCFRYLGYKKGDFPESEKASQEVLSLPLYPQITAKEQEFVVSAIRRFFE